MNTSVKLFSCINNVSDVKNDCKCDTANFSEIAMNIKPDRNFVENKVIIF